MKINKKVLNLSGWISLLTVLFFPAKPAEKSLLYGLPLKFYTEYIDKPKKGRWFFSNSYLNLQDLIYNIIIIYFLIIGLGYLKTKIKNYISNHN